MIVSRYALKTMEYHCDQAHNMQAVCPRLSFSPLKSLDTRLRGGIHKLNSSGVSKGEGWIKDGQTVWQWQPYYIYGRNVHVDGRIECQ